ncbi:N-acetylneuraminate lyase [Pseudolycoriella hygida]|uniref:N-acetylneuraminate lyase n=1 Tax=Pseudolycoriella hygida TaxID=35572 RepID=A0A9Q0NGF4_9DIPT|nr:N-acetylneuraminate lyase [Pseudolycoriella hygida]
MTTTKFYFKGLMSPVFTPFTADKKSIDYSQVDGYAAWLKRKCIGGVLINGTVSEGTNLTTDERKLITEEWSKACRKHDLVLMTQISGTSIKDAYELAEHAEKCEIPAVLCLPDLFFRPTVEEELVDYLFNIAKHCPTRPMYYYHIPQFSHVRLNLARFCDLAEERIPNFCGIEYANGDLAEGVTVLKQGRNVLLGSDTVLAAGLVLGFDSAILTTLNICPEHAVNIYDSISNYKLREAQESQAKLNQRIWDITNKGQLDWIESMKTEFNKVNNNEFGPCRKTITFKTI